MGLLDALRASAAPPPPRTARVAAAVRMAAGNKLASAPRASQGGAGWQARVWAYYADLGEIHYAANFYGKNLGKLRLLVERQGPDGEWVEVDDGPAFDALERVRGATSRGELQANYGRLMFLVGEAFLVAFRDPLEDEPTDADGDPLILPADATGPPERWEVLSADELEVKDGKITRKASGGTAGVEYVEATDGRLEPGTAIAYRLWRPHPRYSALADSPMAAVLDLCEELLLLAKAVRARARSRVAGAGLLLIPNELSPDPLGGVGDDDPGVDPLLEDIVEAMTTPVADEGAASAVVPMILRGPAEMLHPDRLRHLSFAEALAGGYPEGELRAEAVRRIANGLDLPPEVLLGMADANHWTAWQIDDATWSTHLQPAAQQLADDLTAAYLRPMLEAEGQADAGEYRVWYDASGIVNSPDRSRDAKDLHDRLVISDEALRESAGFDENEAPDDAERRRRVGLQLGDASLATGGPATATSSAPAAPAADPPSGQGPADVEPGPPGEAALLAAAECAAWRCREAAGARLVSRLRGTATTVSEAARVAAKADVAAVIGSAPVAALGLEPSQLVAGGADPVRRVRGVNGNGDQLAAAVEAWAARDLFRPTLGPPPPGVLEACRRAGGR